MAETLHVWRSEEPWAENEIYIFDTPTAAEKFKRFIGGGEIVEEPVLDEEFVREARLARIEERRERASKAVT